MYSPYTTTQMNGLAPDEQAKKALLSILIRIRDNGAIGYHVGLGCNTFDLLTEAYATLTGAPVEEVRRAWECRNPTRMVPVGYVNMASGVIVAEVPIGENCADYQTAYAEMRP